MLLTYRPVLRPGSGRLSFAEVSPQVVAVRSSQKRKQDWGGIYVGSAEQMKALTIHFVPDDDDDEDRMPLAFACRCEAPYKLDQVTDVMRALQEALGSGSRLDGAARVAVQEVLDELVRVHVGIKSVSEVGKDAELNF